MKFVFSLLVSLIGVVAHAGVGVVGNPAGDCSTPGAVTIAVLSNSSLGESNGRAYLNFLVSVADCQKGRAIFKAINPGEFNWYFVNMEYSRDVKFTRQQLNDMTIEAEMSFVPSEFFAQTPRRHYRITFYPGPGEAAYNWLMTVFKDEATGNILTSVEVE